MTRRCVALRVERSGDSEVCGAACREKRYGLSGMVQQYACSEERERETRRCVRHGQFYSFSICAEGDSEVCGRRVSGSQAGYWSRYKGYEPGRQSPTGYYI